MAEAVISIRDGRDTDSAAVIHLVEEAYGEYEGCVLLVEEEEPALLAPATAFKKAGGAFWVVELDTHVIACIGVVATDRPELWELRKLYVLRAARKAGLGKILCHRVEDWVLGKGGEAVELFTDTRFTDAHRLYERMGYRRQPDTRVLDDASHTEEFHYVKSLAD